MWQLAGNVVALDEIYAPFRIQPKEAIVIFFGSFFCGVHAVHIRVPMADAIGFGDLPGSFGATEDFGIPMHGLARNAAHDMDAEF